MPQGRSRSAQIYGAERLTWLASDDRVSPSLSIPLRAPRTIVAMSSKNGLGVVAARAHHVF